jgi:UPF0755 protein
MKHIFTSKFLKIIASIAILLGFLFIYLSFVSVAVPKAAEPLTNEGQLRVRIVPGSNVSSVAKQLIAQGIHTTHWEVQVVARGLFLGKKLKSGVYDFPPGATLASILLKMGRGDSVKLSVTLVEGWTFKQFKAAVDAQVELKKDVRTWSANQILVKIQAKESHPEGLFFPDTYIYMNLVTQT